MPELPEVETIVRELDQVLSGKKITAVSVLRAKSFIGDEKELVGKTIESVERRSKMTVVGFSHYPKKLVIHLKMTGQLIYLSGTHRVVGGPARRRYASRIAGGHPTPDWVNELPSKSTRVVIELDNGAKLFFNDLRVFGWLKLMKKEEWEKLTAKLPPDVTHREFNLEYFAKVLVKSGRSIKLVLMDQAKFGGVGNIYANDALYLARINPKRKAKELAEEEVKDLYAAVKKVINLGIKYGGASVDKYVDAAGWGGKYQEHFLVYGRNGQKCKRDGDVIKKIKLGGRGTYFCPGCQQG